MMYKKVTKCLKKLRKVLEVSKCFRNFAPKIVTSVEERTMKTVNSNSQTARQSHPVAVLAFRKGTEIATVVTDGSVTKTFRNVENKSHQSLTNAIGYLESRGYTLDMEEWA